MGRLESRKKQRRLKNEIILYVDGEVEIAYFKHININQIDNVRFSIKKGDEIEFLKNIDDEIPRMIILDIDAITKDNDPKKRYLNIDKILKDHRTNKNVFYNNYSFETFLLLHITDRIEPIYHAKAYDKLMTKYFKLKDKWSRHKDASNLKLIFSMIDQDSLNNAIERTKQFNKDAFLNPSSNMCDFFERIKYLDKVDNE